MIINSDFKDYYDVFAHQYRDERTVYNRRHIVSKLRDIDNSSLRSFVNRYAYGYHVQELNGISKGDINILIIAGRVYPFTTVHIDHTKPEDTIDNRCYVFNNPYKVRDEYYNHYYRNCSKYKPRVEKLVTGERMDECVKICQDLMTPIILIWGDLVYNRDIQRYNHTIELNPPIKKYSPPISTWEIFQEIMSILGSIQPVVPEPSNDEKIEGHGYNLKSSFRPKMKNNA